MRWLPVWSASAECFDRVLNNNGSLQLFSTALRLIGATDHFIRIDYSNNKNILVQLPDQSPRI